MSAVGVRTRRASPLRNRMDICRRGQARLTRRFKGQQPLQWLRPIMFQHPQQQLIIHRLQHMHQPALRLTNAHIDT